MTSMPPVAVLAGGMATRLGELTRTIPKSMQPVAGEPFIAHQLRLFAGQGISRVVLCLGHLSSQLSHFVGDGRQFGLDVVYSEDGPRLLGTGGAVRRALPLLGHEFLVTYGDSYLDISFRAVVEAFHAGTEPAMMTVMHNRDRWDTSNVLFRKGRIDAYSKQPTPDMRHIDYGLAVLKASIFGDIADDKPFDLAGLYQRLVAKKEMGGYLATKRFYEIGSPAGLAETDAHLRQVLAR
jgi:NDP-sugar pyrophosphorylase family protein